ncbi:MAG: S41 family peptidase [Sphingobacteriaceae bacterium]|nr:S41 family peptidase [Sphingobacteriaceae bacterium]
MHSSTKSNLLIASCYAGILALGMVVGPKLGLESHAAKSGNYLPSLSGGEEKVEQVLEIIRENYVDPVKVDTLQNLAINQILSHLDPHSSYLPPVKAREQSQDLEGNYYGIGVEYTLLRDTMLVTTVKHGPAERAGIGAGDKILQIGAKKIAGTHTSSKEIVALIKGRAGTSVSLMVKKREENKLQRIVVKRDKITVSSIDAAYMLTPTVGYVKISKFGAATAEDFSLEMGRLQNNSMKSLILDLRHNGGGYLNAATALADEFLPDKQLIVYTQGEHEPRTDYFATNSGKFEHGRLILLIDESTASASEVVAGAIQDLDRGTVIGRRSFGKGLVQGQFNFGDGSALNLTIARYYTPLGRSIQRPYKMSQEEYFQETSKRLQQSEASIVDSVSDKKHSYKTGSGRVLYDGGGITPDIHIPVDTSSFNSFYYALREKGILTEFLFSKIIGTYTPASIKNIIDQYHLNDNQYQELISMAIKSGIKTNSRMNEIAREAVNTEIKALLGKVYFGDEAYYRVLNARDKVIARSLQELKQP